MRGRWHDNRHTFITGLAESGQAGDKTIRNLAGHVSKQMLKHYSHIRMEAKRKAVEALIAKSEPGKTGDQTALPSPECDAVLETHAKESTKDGLIN